MEFTQINQKQSAIADFSDHPLSSLFFEYINILKQHHFLKEAEDLLAVAKEYHLPENRNIITKIIIEMQKAAVSDEKNKFKQLLEQLQS
jgi:hypothetical protein